MGFETFTDLSALYAASMNNLMKQSVIVCTSGTRPSSPVEGMHIYQTDTDTVAVYNGTSWVEITPEAATVATAETTTSASYVDLATAGPAVTLTTGTKALITVGALFNNSVATAVDFMGFAVSGATTLAAASTCAVSAHLAYAGGNQQSFSKTIYYGSLTAGSNVFTAKYATNGGTATFTDRYISVAALP